MSTAIQSNLFATLAAPPGSKGAPADGQAFGAALHGAIDARESSGRAGEPAPEPLLSTDVRAALARALAAVRSARTGAPAQADTDAQADTATPTAQHDAAATDDTGARGTPQVPENEAGMVATAVADRPAPGRTTAAVGSDPLRVTRDVAALAPEFRPKLERVVRRMEELGYEVRVLETHRTQARQDQLFEQGRSRPGPVVTWTRNSNHAQGRAADLHVSGGAGDGYEVLARVAGESGLRTLGAADPGHVELPRQGALPAARSQAPSTLHVQTPAAVTQGGVAVAARVADVAQVAGVATVATVAMPGITTERVAAPASAVARSTRDDGASVLSTVGTPTRTAHDETSSVRPAHATAASASRSVQHAATLGRPSGTRDDRPTLADATPPEARAVDESPRVQDAGVIAMPAPAATAAAQTEPAAAVRDASIAARVERVLQLQESLASQPVSQVSLQIDDAAGDVARIHIGLRGGDLSARIDVSDPASALRLDSRLGELREILQRQGLDASSLQVRAGADLEARTAQRMAEMLSAASLPGTEAAQKGRDAGAHGGQHDRPSGDTRQHHDSNRQRQRRDTPQENRK